MTKRNSMAAKSFDTVTHARSWNIFFIKKNDDNKRDKKENDINKKKMKICKSFSFLFIFLPSFPPSLPPSLPLSLSLSLFRDTRKKLIFISTEISTLQLFFTLHLFFVFCAHLYLPFHTHSHTHFLSFWYYFFLNLYTVLYMKH